MKKEIVQYYEGNSIRAYHIFGAHLTTLRGRKGVKFSTYAPNAKKIEVIGSFNNWQGQEMKRSDERGIYSLFIAGAKEGDLYKYRVTQVDGTVVDKSDPYAFGSELRPNTASIIRDLTYNKWNDEEWMNNRTNNYNKPLNIYEVHLGSWKMEQEDLVTIDENGNSVTNFINYRSIAKDLVKYCKQMKFTHVELMPLSEYPFDGSWGYQCSGYFSVTSRYGKPNELKYLINALHKNGIGVIMDFVPVHFVKDNYALAYFDGTPLYEYDQAHDANSEWGTSNFNLGREEVRSFLMSAAAFWLDEFHVDGLRMDAVSNLIFWHGNKDKGINEEALHFVKRMNYNLHEAFPSVMLIAEDSSDFPKVTHPTIYGGLGFDYKWDLGWMNDTLKYLEKDPVYRKWEHNKITFSMAYFYSERFILPFSHDEVVHGKKTIVDKIYGTYEQKFAQAKTLYMYMMTHPGKKLNFMGNELAHFREWDEAKSCDWKLLTYPAHDSFHEYFKKLNSLYTKINALNENDMSGILSFEWIDADNCDENLFSYMRKSADRTIVVILNFSPNVYTQHPFGVVNEGIYHEILNSEQDIYGGNIMTSQKVKATKEECNNKPYQIKVDVPAFGGVMLEVKVKNKKK